MQENLGEHFSNQIKEGLKEDYWVVATYDVNSSQHSTILHFIVMISMYQIPVFRLFYLISALMPVMMKQQYHLTLKNLYTQQIILAVVLKVLLIT